MSIATFDELVVSQFQVGGMHFGYNDDPWYITGQTGLYPEGLSYAIETGADCMRFPVLWSFANPSQGNYEWGYAQPAYDICINRGIIPVFSVYGGPNWACGAGTGVLVPKTSQALSFWQFFMSQLASHFPEAVIQCWNEPNHQPFMGDATPAQMAAVINACANGVNASSSENKVIIAPAMTPASVGTALTAGEYRQEMFDAVTATVNPAVHLYPGPPNHISQMTADINACKAFGTGDVWITEVGMYQANFGGPTEQDNASIAAYDLAESLDCAAIIFHRLRTSTDNGFEIAGDFGIIEGPPYVKTSLYYALQEARLGGETGGTAVGASGVSSRGEYSSGLLYRGVTTRLYKYSSKKGVLLLGGWGSDADVFTTELRMLNITNAIKDAGFATAAIATDQTWGNAAMQTRITNFKTYAENVLDWFASDDIHIVGVSMGSLCALNWTRANPTLVASLSLILPLVDLQRVYDTNPYPNLFPSMQAAYGGRPPDLQNPMDNISSFTSIDHKFWYTDNDALCIKSDVETFAATSGGELENMGIPNQAGEGFGIPGHSLANLDATEIAAWIVAND